MEGRRRNHFCSGKAMIIELIQYNIVVCCYDKILVNVAVYVITG